MAGMGRRMVDNTLQPKALLNIPNIKKIITDKEGKKAFSEERIIDRMIRMLQIREINGISLVVGYKWKEMIRLFPDHNYIISDPSGTTEVLRSLYNCMSDFSRYSNNLILLGDTVFDDKALDYMVSINPVDTKMGIVFFGDDKEIYGLSICSKGVSYLKQFEFGTEFNGKNINEARLWDFYKFLKKNFNIKMNKMNGNANGWIRDIDYDEDYDKVNFNLPIVNGAYE